jgi:Archaeal PaREP1/PaREP8 family.
VDRVVRIALSLRRFSYDGLDLNLVDYRNLHEVRGDVLEVVKWVIGVEVLFKGIWDDRLSREVDELISLDIYR